MFRVGVAVLAAAALLGVATLAFGQDVVPIKVSAVVKVTPNKAGTPRHPQGVKVDVRAKIDIPHDYDPPLVQSVTSGLSKAGVYNGAQVPDLQLRRRWSAAGCRTCPARSIMGHATGTADADGVKSYPKVTIVNGGAHFVYFYVVLSTPARVQQPIAATITKLTSARWQYRLDFKIPRNLQIVAGIPLRAEGFHATFGREDWIATHVLPAGSQVALARRGALQLRAGRACRRHDRLPKLGTRRCSAQSTPGSVATASRCSIAWAVLVAAAVPAALGSPTT